jgi:hypothetical protein
MTVSRSASAYCSTSNNSKSIIHVLGFYNGNCVTLYSVYMIIETVWRKLLPDSIDTIVVKFAISRYDWNIFDNSLGDN